MMNKLGGPPGCLQFYVATTARVSTFNWKSNTRDEVDILTGTHLSNQNYDVCVRRERGFCGICWIPTVYGVSDMGMTMQTLPDGFDLPPTPTRGSFGLSVSPDANQAEAENGDECTEDYIVIPNGEKRDKEPPAAEGDLNVAKWPIRNNNIEIGINRYCGRFLNVDREDAHDECVCSRVTPFTLTVVTDANERVANAAAGQAGTNEASANAGNAGGAAEYPLGTMGFSLDYTQQICV